MMLEQYKVVFAHLDTAISVSILSEETGRRYDIAIPDVSGPTKLLLQDVKDELIGAARLPTIVATNVHEQEEVQRTVGALVDKSLKQHVPSVPPETRKLLVLYVVNEMTGLGDIEYLMQDPNLEEIVVPAAREAVMVFHKKHGWLTTNLRIASEEQVQNYAAIIARKVGRDVSVLHPILDARLTTGDRANAVLYPIANKGNTLTIRKFARDPWTFVDFIKNGTCTAKVFALLWIAIQYEMNVLFSGGTASGKTSMLNVCMPFVPPNQRLISIEDTRELQLPTYLFWEPLVTRIANPEGKGEVNMLDLLVTSLRMRPDRIILGEVRRGDHATVLFEAMHTGHSVYATVHADNAQETINRLVNPPISIPANLLEAVHINVVMFRDRRKGLRRVFQVAEFVSENDAGVQRVKPNLLYRYTAAEDAIVKHGESMSIMEKLCQHLGCTLKEIQKELVEREAIITWLAKRDFSGVDRIATIMQVYYATPQRVVDAATKDLDPNEFAR